MRKYAGCVVFGIGFELNCFELFLLQIYDKNMNYEN